MKRVLVVAPHPDDETLGCGGTLLKHLDQGDEIHWLIVTDMRGVRGFSKARRKTREGEIRKVARRYGFSPVHSLRFPTAKLDTVPLDEVVRRMRRAFDDVAPTDAYLPFPGDVHSDHRIAFEAAAACSKWFRRPSLRRLLCYETPSETDMGLHPDAAPFRPNLYIDIGPFLDGKIRIFKNYSGEQGRFPFPRSEEAIRALAAHRGAGAGCRAAEAFMLLKELG